MQFLDFRSCLLAGFAALVVGAGSKFVLYAGVNENQFVALGMEGEVLVFSGFAIEADKGAFLAENGSELVHDAALYTAVIVLCALAYLCKFKLLYLVVPDIVKGICEGAFKGCGGAEACTKRNVTGKNGVEAFHLAAAFEGFTAHAKDIAGPCLCGLVLFLEAET